MDTAMRGTASVALVVPADRYEDVLEQVTDLGILVIAKPFPPARIGHAIRFLCAQQDTVRRMERKIQAAEEKAEEIRLVDRAKFVLVEQRHMTEEEAHRYILRQAMDNGISRRRAALEITEEW